MPRVLNSDGQRARNRKTSEPAGARSSTKTSFQISGGRSKSRKDCKIALLDADGVMAAVSMKLQKDLAREYRVQKDGILEIGKNLAALFFHSGLDFVKVYENLL